jgi:hypothetical protein
MYPANLLPGSVKLANSRGEIAVIPVLKQGYEVNKSTDLVFTIEGYDGWTASTLLAPVSDNNQQAAVPGKNNPWTLAAENVPGTLLNDGKINPEALQDIILIIPFNGTLGW